MAKVWVKGYTKADGTKVSGHYRDAYDYDGIGSHVLPRLNSKEAEILRKKIKAASANRDKARARQSALSAKTGFDFKSLKPTGPYKKAYKASKTVSSFSKKVDRLKRAFDKMYK